MNSPDFWRPGIGLCPDHRGYPTAFRALLTPIGGGYLEIPSTTGCQYGIHARLHSCLKSTGGSSKQSTVSQLISFSVDV